MNRIITFLIIVFVTQLGFGQILRINELDCDTPGTDDKEFVELKSQTPNFPLDGYVVVFFNGSTSGGNMSYLALDLDGYETDINGLLLIGSTTVSPFPQYIIPQNVIQNGADAVAIYQADEIDFEEPVLAYVDETLIDVMLYQTNDSDGQGLLTIFSEFDPTITILNEGAGNNTNSIQLDNGNNDMGYLVQAPTPRRLNDGSGVVLNGILMTLSQTMYNEGESFDIVFTSEQNVTEDLNFTLNLNNGTFDASDFTGNTSITIPNGSNTATTTITLVDDTLDEGDEEMVIRVTGLPPTFSALNNNLRIRAVDNDFTVASFGTPINPTYGIVESTQPDGYYDSLEGFADNALRQGIQSIIAEEGVVRAQTYADIVDILKEADQNPENSNQVWLVYKEIGRAKLDYQTTSSNIGKWNREHTYPRSRGGFNNIEADDIADGRDIFWNTTADSLRHGNSDAHALRAVDGPENSSRGNQHYGQYNGPMGTLGGFKGDVARSVLYMELRYNGLQVVNGFPEGTVGQLGDLATLLDWHRNDPPDDFEMNRNNVVYTWQFNRNPLIDHPDLVEYIWGTNVGDPWNPNLNVDEVNDLAVKIFPNPSNGTINFLGIRNNTFVDIFSTDGRKLSSFNLEGDRSIDLNLKSGLYLMQISSEGKIISKKLIIN
ncbi:endonuclease [Subsaxibacter sp. CAU 1640]|uniref:endonuclease n=1 Tax=Subsaxibacter sp. CAU 1640 TaxID=2933271 RepID=UPI002004E0C6|nr:endonuclease [Subsaxibacter sp. CAU 1640]MCK7591386.1 endonuclease [Subsaxibacter sp. CAU 1640]